MHLKIPTYLCTLTVTIMLGMLYSIYTRKVPNVVKTPQGTDYVQYVQYKSVLYNPLYSIYNITAYMYIITL